MKIKEQFTYFETIVAIEKTKNFFEKKLENNLNLIKTPGPIFLKTSSGLQDQLTGSEKAISFKRDNETYEIVHSLAKWKREALGKYQFKIHTGLYTDMKAIRKEDEIDDIHSLYVEQWDWEKIITKKDRNINYLKETVNQIYEAIKETSTYLKDLYPFLTLKLPNKVYFITSQELENLYPNNTPIEREQLIGKEKKVVF